VGKEKKRTKQKDRASGIILRLIIFIILLICAIFISVSYRAKYRTAFYSGARIGGIDVGNLSEADAVKKVNEKYMQKTFTVTKNGKTQDVIKYGDVAEYSAENDVKKALSRQNSTGSLLTLRKGASYEISRVSADEEKLKKRMARYTKSSDRSTNASVSYNKNVERVVLIKSHQGTQYDMNVLASDVQKAISRGDKSIEIADQKYYIKPAVTTDSQEIQQKYQAISRVAGHTVTLRSADGKTEKKLASAEYMPHVSYSQGKMSVDQTWLKQYVRSLDAVFNTPEDGLKIVTPDDNKEHAIKKGTYGQTVNSEEEIKQLGSDILSGTDVSRNVTMKANADDYKLGTFIFLSIKDQKVRMYKKGKKILDAPVVTGKDTADRRTTPGAYYIFYKKSPAVLKGPGYASRVDFFAAFHNGQGFHNAPWRNQFGGSIWKTNGSHGCVNMSYKDGQLVYANCKVGTPVFIE
jgi:hypothetical protein